MQPRWIYRFLRANYVPAPWPHTDQGLRGSSGCEQIGSLDETTLSYLIGLFLLLSLSAFFSAAETALFSLSRLRLQRLAQTEPQRGGRVLKLLERPIRT
ncbi:MAG: CNNM domain-containing protein, partial [Candidatus Methylomirabilales bacterium]